MAFPGPYAQIYYNEAGEVLGWDNVYPEDPAEREFSDEDDRQSDQEEIAYEEAYELAEEQGLPDESCERFAEYRIRRSNRRRTVSECFSAWTFEAAKESEKAEGAGDASAAEEDSDAGAATLRCDSCGQASEKAIGARCLRDLTPEVNELLEIHLPDRYITCPGRIEEMYA